MNTFTITLPKLDFTCLGWFFGEMTRREPVFASGAFLMISLVPPTLLAMAFDDRMLAGVGVWVKPLKFEMALAVYLATLAWFAGWLPTGTTHRRWYRVHAATVLACVLIEIVWICGSAAAGVPSHFNFSTPLMAWLYQLMGVGAVTLTSASLVYGWLIARDQRSALEPVFRSSVVTGLILTFILTLIVAGAMSNGTTHLVGGNASDAEGFPGMGWARDGGDLRVAHFFATHALHFLPIVGFVAGRVLEPRFGRMVVAAASLLYVALVLFTFFQAHAGKSFLAWLA